MSHHLDFREKPHTVYLHRGNDSTILYVGCTMDLHQRTGRHRSKAHWWTKVAAVEIDSIHPDWLSGSGRENQLIRQYDPPFNIGGSLTRRRENDAWQVLATTYSVPGAMELMAALGTRSNVEALRLSAVA